MSARVPRSLFLTFLVSLGVSAVMLTFVETDFRAQYQYSPQFTMKVLSPANGTRIPRGLVSMTFDITGTYPGSQAYEFRVTVPNSYVPNDNSYIVYNASELLRE